MSASQSAFGDGVGRGVAGCEPPKNGRNDETLFCFGSSAFCIKNNVVNIICQGKLSDKNALLAIYRNLKYSFDWHHVSGD